MQGFPPPPKRIIGQPDSNYFSFPKMRWTVCHFRELLPTKQVSRGLGAPVPFSYRGMWWSLHNEHGAFAARGVHGQTIYIDPTPLPAYQAVAEYLMEKAQS